MQCLTLPSIVSSCRSDSLSRYWSVKRAINSTLILYTLKFYRAIFKEENIESQKRIIRKLFFFLKWLHFPFTLGFLSTRERKNLLSHPPRLTSVFPCVQNFLPFSHWRGWKKFYKVWNALQPWPGRVVCWPHDLLSIRESGEALRLQFSHIIFLYSLQTESKNFSAGTEKCIERNGEG